MTRYKLTAGQKSLLKTLVRLTDEGKLKDPIVPIPVRNGKTGALQYVLHLRGADSYYFTNISDLDHFCNLGFMTFRWNRQGIGKLFSLTRIAAAAVENQFEQPFTQPGATHYPELIVQAMMGELDPNQPAPVFPDIDVISADPILLHTTVETLCANLLDVVHTTCRGSELTAYTQVLSKFKDAIYNGRIAPKELQTYTYHLAGLNQQTPLPLTIWPYLYPLLLIAEKRQ